MTFASYTNIVEPTVIPLAGTFTAQVNDIDAGGLQKPGGTASSADNSTPTVSAGLDHDHPAPHALRAHRLRDRPGRGPAGLPVAAGGRGRRGRDRADRPGQGRRAAAAFVRSCPGGTRVFPDLAQVVAGNTNAATGTCASGDLDCWSEWLPTAAYTPPRCTSGSSRATGTRAVAGRRTTRSSLTLDKGTGPFRVTSQALARVRRRWHRPDRHLDGEHGRAGGEREDLAVGGWRPDVPDRAACEHAQRRLADRDAAGDAAAQARIKVEAVGNYFFDVSHADLTITEPPTGLSVLGMPASATTQYSDPLVFAFTAESANAPLDSVVASQTGLPAGLALTKTAPGAWAVTGAVTAAPGTYPVHLEVTDGTETKVFDRSVVVTRESATATYDGDTERCGDPGWPGRGRGPARRGRRRGPGRHLRRR